MPNPYSAKKKAQGKANPWAGRSNGNKPADAKPKTLGDLLRAKKKTKPLPQKQCKEDFYAGGLLYWNAKVTDGPYKGETLEKIVTPRGTVDVSNGDVTYTFHNRYGSWMADIGAGRMAELAWVAAALGTSMSQVEMYRHVSERFEAELKKQDRLTRDQQRILLERQAEEARKKSKAPKTPAKPAASSKKTNPYAKGKK
jgi:hypothetical protein